MNQEIKKQKNKKIKKQNKGGIKKERNYHHLLYCNMLPYYNKEIIIT